MYQYRTIIIRRNNINYLTYYLFTKNKLYCFLFDIG